MIARLLSASAFAALLASGAIAQTAVPVAHFDGVELRGGGHIVFRYGAVQRMTLLKGSTQYTRFEMEDSNKLVISACNENCPMHYDLEIEITTPDIEAVAVAGGGQIEVASGFPAQRNIDVAIKGGGQIDARNLKASSANAAVSGGGQIDIGTTRALTAAVNGGGQIHYSGNPSVTSAINGGGEVNRE